MNANTYTQCPKCRTVFTITPAQIKARAGLVRCGRCGSPFQADRNLLAAPGAPAPVPPEPKAAAAGTGEIPTVSELLTGKRRRPTRPLFWWLGSVAALLVLAGQAVYFFSTPLARVPALHPWVARACAYLGCRIYPPQDVALIELSNTGIAPNPKYENALRIRGTLVNRAGFVQPFPLMEVTLTDNQGGVVARRTFPAGQYLAQPADVAAGMPPGVAFNALLDITSPGPNAVGYEIRLVSAPN